MKPTNKGFSLMELVVVVTIIAILMTLAYPSYINFIRKAHRSDAALELLDWANRQQIWRADHTTYNANINPGNTEHYTFAISNMTATTYTLTATPQWAQANDKEDGVACSSLTLDEDGTQGPSGKLVCWE